MSNSLYGLRHDSYGARSENWVLDQLTILQLIFLFILITCLFDIVLALQGEILPWSLTRFKG